LAKDLLRNNGMHVGHKCDNMGEIGIHLIWRSRR
jgi:hypothetical protein